MFSSSAENHRRAVPDTTHHNQKFGYHREKYGQTGTQKLAKRFSEETNKHYTPSNPDKLTWKILLTSEQAAAYIAETDFQTPAKYLYTCILHLSDQ